MIYFLFQETKQKSLEEIDLLFGGRALGTLPEDVADKDFEVQHVENKKPTAENIEHSNA